MVEVVGSMEDDGGDEDGVYGQVLHAEPVQLRHVAAYRWAEKIVCTFSKRLKIS